MGPQLPEGLDRRAGFWLREVSNALHERFSAALARHDMSPPLWTILLMLFRAEAKTPAALVRRLYADPAAITRRLDRLEHMGLVRRTRSRRDRRSVGLALTADGRKLVPVLSEISRQLMEKAFSGIPEAERARLLETLQHMHANLAVEDVRGEPGDLPRSAHG